MHARRVVLTIASLLVIAPQLGAQAPATPSRQSWTSDRRDFRVGDVITVLVDEYTLATANQGTFSSDRRFRDARVGARQTVVPTAPSGGGIEFSTANAGESRQRGEAIRQNRFQGEMTVRVLEIDPTGLLRIEGTKVVNIDKNREELVLRGWVRPQDVSSQNLLDSWRVGDAELVYTSKGPLSRPRGGIISRIIGAIWP